MRALRSSLGLYLACLGCASEWPSTELVSARSAYDEARVSRAATFGQARLAEARRALDRAEGAHLAAPDTPEARALAYVALRRAELAKTAGDYEFDRHIAAELREGKNAGRSQPPEDASPGPATPPPAAPASAETPSSGDVALEPGVLAEELAGLEPHVTVNGGHERTLITLDSSFLFVPKKAEVAASAHEKLDKIAQALGKLDETSAILVLGHTDSVGPDANNLELSKRRAEQVRTYLVGRGVAADRIRSEGRGARAPVATNDTAEGRASNRRIEIVVARGGVEKGEAR